MMAHPLNDANMEFREILGVIGRRIDDYTLENLKYQCRSVIRPGRLERVVTTNDLFNVLEEMDELSYDNIDFLVRILKNVDRIDLTKILVRYFEKYRDFNNDLKADSKPSVGDYRIKHHEHNPYTQPPNLTIPFNTFGTSTESTGRSSNNFNVSIPAQNPRLTTAVEFVVSRLSRGWQGAARHLGVPDVIIDNAEENWPRDIRRQIRETFRFWARNDSSPSLQKLIDAMRKIGRNDIADELQYGGG